MRLLKPVSLFPTLAALLCLGLLILLSGCGGSESTSPFPGGALFALSPTQTSVSRYSLSSGPLTPNLFTTGAQPVDLALRLGKAYVLDAATRSLQVFTTADGVPLGNVPLGDNAVPVRVLPYVDTVAYVTDSGTGSLLIVDPKAGTLTRQIALGGTPTAMAITLSKIYVTNTQYDPVAQTYGQGTVSVVSTSTGNALLNSISVGSVPLAIVADTSGSVDVLCAGAGGEAASQVYHINGRYDVIIGAPVALGGHAVDLALGEDKRVYAPASASAGLGTSAGVIVYDWETGALVCGGDNPIAVGPDPMSAVALSGKRVAVADRTTGEVHLINETLAASLLTTFTPQITRLAAE